MNPTLQSLAAQLAAAALNIATGKPGTISTSFTQVETIEGLQFQTVEQVSVTITPLGPAQAANGNKVDTAAGTKPPV